ncbi:hypothetical protein [Pseudomonas taeanensis]|uniref:hypothetical protein n=1 Tax=Pseudomonas taeanensis TaxID=574962 RepID=UPI00046AF658|nr:hypothetical protein [Pseudomonas taeanensis]
MAFEELEREITRSRNFVLFVAITPLVIYMTWFIAFNNQDISKNATDWGAFGDFVGGLINPLIAFFAFYWLTKSVLIQKIELSETKKALQDTQKSQEEQAKIALKAAKLQSLNILLTSVNHQIAQERDYINYVIREIQRNGVQYTVMTREGDSKKANDIIPPAKELLSKLLEEQALLTEQVKSLAIDT